MAGHKQLDFINAIVDEIALEGLDGITIEGLWLRLEHRPSFVLSLDECSKSFIWNLIRAHTQIEFYQLQEPRQPLTIINRFDFVDPDIGTVLEPAVKPYDHYPIHLINDVENGVKGSCAQYSSRENVTEEIRNNEWSLQAAASKWGLSLVLVASQALRDMALMSCSVDPTVDISPMRYCILERIGRSRYHGEVTQGKTGLQELESEPKCLFYHRKFLSNYNLITKQNHHQKSGVQNVMGLLLHLPRFYVERQPKSYVLTRRVIELLKAHPNGIADYEEVRRTLGTAAALKKLFKTPEFKRYVKPDLRVPYRTLYPNAKPREWKRKSSDQERMLRAMQLLDPDPEQHSALARDEDDGVEVDVDLAKHEGSPSHLLLDRSLLHQAFYHVDAAGANGVSQVELSNLMGITKLHSRTFCRNLLRMDLLATVLNDIGRQRVIRYMSKRVLPQSKLAIQFLEEKEKMYLLTKNKDLQGRKKKKIRATCSKGSDVETKVAEEDKVLTSKKAGKRKASSRLSRAPSKKLKTETITKSAVVSIPPAVVETPPAVVETPPAVAETPPAVAETPPAVVVTPPAVAETPPALVDTPPALVETPPAVVDICAEITAIDVDVPAVAAEVSPQPLPTVDEVKPVADIIEQDLTQQAGVSQLNSVETEITEVMDGAFGHNENVLGFVEELRLVHPRHTKDSPGVTYRLLKRANLIIQAVQTHKVIDDLSKLIRMITEVEDREGYMTKIDKKSLLRLLVKLNKDKNIKFLRITLKAGEKIKILNFVCQPDIADDHPMIMSAIEQEKLKFFIPVRSKVVKAEETRPARCPTQDAFSEKQVQRSINELKAISAKEPEMAKLVADRNAGKLYGFCPKFIRLRTVHQLLFYLVYGYKGTEDLDQNSAVKEMLDRGAVLSNDDIAELPSMFRTELDWRTFIPPLLPLPGWPSGWAIVCDILLRIPLSIFVKIFNVTYRVPQLQDYLSHPTRRHFLLKSLPLNMRNNLMAGRKYIFSFHEMLQRLCFIGVAQFGPQRLKEKDQVFFFLNRHANLLDTMTSRPGYHQISPDVVYAQHDYVFNTSDDVDKYWYEMWSVCLRTPLGGRLCVSGKDIVLEVLENKPAMLEALQVRAPMEAPERDTGFVPGDRRGAAGLDSALFSHLKRNWNWTNAHQHSKLDLPALEKLMEGSPSQNLRRTRIESMTASTVPPVKNITFTGGKGKAKGTQVTKPECAEFPIPLVRPSRAKAKAYVRTVKPRRHKKTVRLWYDDIDHKTEESMTRRRAKWSDEEDNLLLLCKVAMVFLCPNPRKQIINFQAMRDVCHATMPSTRNKTSRACQRRINVMMKNKATVKNVSLHLEEVKHDDFLVKHFADTMTEVKAHAETAEAQELFINEKYRQLVAILQKKFNRHFLASGGLTKKNTRFVIPDQPQQLIDAYKVLLPPDSMKVKGKFQEARNIVDILCATVTTIVHSTLCSLPDKTSYMYQLFKIYQQYPDNLLRSVMAKLRTDQMVSLRKTYIQMLHKTGNYLPVSSLPYQLSITYFYILQTKYDYDVFDQCGVMMKKLVACAKQESSTRDETSSSSGPKPGLECMDLDGGSAACLVELFVQDKLSLILSIPENIVILDPKIKESDAPYKKIMATYQDIVRNCGSETPLPPCPLLDKSSGAAGEAEDELGSGDTATDQPPCHLDVKAIDQYAEASSDEEELFHDQEETVAAASKVQGPLSRMAQFSIARAASRIALFAMREDLRVAGGGEKQHAHDLLVVNSCQVACRLRGQMEDRFAFRGRGVKRAGGEEHQDRGGTSNFQEQLLDVKKKCVEMLQTINRSLIVPEDQVSMEDAHQVFIEAGASDEDWQHACNIVSYIECRKEVGATIKVLRERFSPTCGLPLEQLLTLLTRTRYVSRVGVTTVHYVRQPFLKPWLLHSYKIKRLEREKLPPPLNLAPRAAPKRSAAAEDRRRLTKIKRDADYGVTSTPSTSRAPAYSDQLFGHGAVAPSDSVEGDPVPLGSPSVAKVDKSDTEMLDVMIRPWVRVDGSLNRRVLDRMLGSVLSVCMLSPGMSIKKLQDRFSPALQPLHTREIVEMLEKIGCLRLQVIIRCSKPSLFSKQSTVTIIENATGTEDEATLVVKLAVDAITKLSVFVGDKAYRKDFLESM